jgi:hypothetical protein
MQELDVKSNISFVVTVIKDKRERHFSECYNLNEMRVSPILRTVSSKLPIP